MKCPRDGSGLAEQRYEAEIMVDACPTCAGIWLDQGEIDLLRQIQSSTGPVSRIMSDILGLFKHPR